MTTKSGKPLQTRQEFASGRALVPKIQRFGDMGLRVVQKRRELNEIGEISKRGTHQARSASD